MRVTTAFNRLLRLPGASVIDALYRLGAASVIVAEGPGNIRDTDLLLDESGLRAQLEILKRASFVDLDFDSVTRVVPGTGLTQLEEIWIPTTVQSADVVTLAQVAASRLDAGLAG